MSPWGARHRASGSAFEAISRGDVWWVEHPETKSRPYLILMRPTAVPVLNSLIAVPTTRTIRSIASEVVLDEDDGMPERCALLLDKVTSVPRGQFTTRITSLGPDRLHQVCAALKYAVGC